MTDHFPRAVAFFWQPAHSGHAFRQDGSDRDTAVSWGVSWHVWSGWAKKNALVTSFTAFRALPRETFLPLLRTWFWNALRCPQMGAVGIQLFDIAALAGPEVAVRYLQTVLAVAVDGEIGPVTMGALHAVELTVLSQALLHGRTAFQTIHPDVPWFRPTDDARVIACHDLVASLLAAPGIHLT
ncbi:glycosyl hydrolase 108 family protein [Rhodopila globiformis]|uniref:TtsA-like Glycoside hydrolase family 108 domain-containing protein n=1 Tax=Rhodopila globiformis TaxID=1071 RepID=A0A2S6NBD2_RHOGL|nr:glycosyl hydrolase 108 family protein [Rhodopila globiformis]PPQ31925.1 hypothetical protein CCS01_16255 [Rhodopila globiformis]